ncbi:MAG TPA: penicillin acylase family protein [Burkholderiales bacterium]|nr:penicillin acylase family protein [Burkholderiales bacterium]
MLKRAALFLFFLISGLIVLGYALLRLSLPVVDGEVALAGLSAPVTVERDAQGVPTVRGASRIDVARATGFLHAQDRYFQMDLLRRQAAGELSALFGPRALDIDRRQRLHRMRNLAERTLNGLSANERALVAAYTDGVNEGLARLTVRPPEYLLLRASPQPWRPEDTVLAVHAMFFQLADAPAGYEARSAALRDCVPGPVAAFLAGNDAAWAAPVDGGTLEVSPLPEAASYDLRRLPGLDFGPRSFEAMLAADPDHPAGSNSWAVAGSRTRDGRALVANDMHLKLRVPNIWYRMRLIVDSATAPLAATGVTLPGTPAVVVGSTGKVAWGFTNSYGDWSDRVLLEPEPGKPERYRAPGGYRPYAVHDEVIEVKGGSRVTFPVRWTLWGPVVPDHRNRPVALQWLGHREEAANLVLMELEQAADVVQALAIAQRSGVPPQNFVVADAHGSIGWTIAGRIPLRQGYDSGFPASHASGDTGWRGWLAPESYPRIVNPADGIIWTANHQVVTGDALALIGGNGYWHGARASQIRDDLRALAQPSENDMLTVQLDDRALLMTRWQRLLISQLTPELMARHPRGAEFRETVAAWNQRAGADSASYRFVHAFRARVRETVFAAITAPCRKLDPKYAFEGFRQDEGPLWTLVVERPPHLLNPRYPDWDAQLQAVVLETVDYFHRNFEGPFANRTWGEHNTLSMRHPLSLAVPWLAPLLDMERSPMSGDRHVPRVQSRDDGASERFGVSPGRERDGYFAMPGGQSGHPLSPWYRAGHRAWARGQSARFLPGPAAHTLRLTSAVP